MTVPTQPTTNPLTDAVIDAAVDHAIEEARRQGNTPKAVIGTAPPVPQPGRPPMSQRAVDINTTILSASVASVPIGGMTSLVLYTLGHVDPVTLAIAATAPATLAVPILAAARLLSRAKQAMPDEHHHHYEGPVYQDQRNVQTKNTGLWAKTTNQQ
jgi:hypothetical protein